MKNIRATLFILIFVIINYSYSQEREPLFHIGGYGGYNINYHTKDFDSLPGGYNCPSSNTGSGSGYSIGLLWEHRYSKVTKLEIRGGFSALSGKFTNEKHLGTWPVKTVSEPHGNDTLDVWVNHTLNSTIYTAGIEPSISFDILWGFNIFAGFRAAYMITSVFDLYEEIKSPANYIFLNDSYYRYKKTDNEIPEKNPVQAFALIGARWDIPLGNEVYIVPEARYYYPLTSLSASSWKVASLEAGISLKLPIYPQMPVRRDTLIQRDTTEKLVPGMKTERIYLSETKQKPAIQEKNNEKVYWTAIYEFYIKEIPQPVKIESKIDVTGVYKDGKRQKNPDIIIEEVEIVKETLPLLPYIFFKEGSSDITKTDVNVLTKEETMRFSDDSLKPKTLVQYIELINIVGYRMNKLKNAKLSIVGCNNNLGPEAGNLDLSSARAKAVKEYLVNIWGIDPKRIETSSQNLPTHPANNKVEDGQRENQRIEFYSDTDELLAPIMIKSVTRQTKIPYAEIQPNINAEIGLKNWSINVEQKGKTLRTYNGTTENPPSIIKWDILEEPIPEINAKVNITLKASDKIDQASESETSCTVSHKHIRTSGDDIKGGVLVERFYIIAHFGKSDLLANQMQFLNHIKSRIAPNSKVTIAGYADRTGTPEINKKLADKRVNDVQKVLKVKESNLTRKPIGSDILLYDNDLPQGRCYSRTIQVTIETYKE